MGERYWLWTGARLLFGAAIIGWFVSYLQPGSGEKEFQKTLDAMKKVHSVRVSFTANPGTQHNEMLWEVDCNRKIVHQQLHLEDTSTNPPVDMRQDHTQVANQEFQRQSDGSWSKPGYAYQGSTAYWFCNSLAQGTDSNLLPPIATMIHRAVIQKGDKKTVNGVRCREWFVTMRNGTANLAHDTVCLGVDDHLPYEMTVDWEHSRSTFSDYNTPLQIELPEAAVQSTTN
ncbi:MAG TPA: hypothetical protein VKV39_06305 [Candidatus Sulfotelmatobacter sp.]|nr:hypothetical protein [Candidatus Sulfotelmatobacter sp.]